MSVWSVRVGAHVNKDETRPLCLEQPFAFLPRHKMAGDLISRRDRHYIAHSPLENLKALLPSFASSSSSATLPPPNDSNPDSYRSSRPTSSSTFLQDPYVVGILSAAGGIGLALGGLKGYRRYWKRIRNSNDVTATMLDSKRWVRGVVTRLVQL
jgi:hypothetical protein